MKTKQIVNLIVNSLKEEITNYEMLAIFHMAGMKVDGKDPKPFDNFKFSCVYQAYIYFRTQQEIIRVNKPITIDVPDQYIIVGAVSALKNSDSDEAHEYISNMASIMSLSDNFMQINWLKELKARTFTVEELIKTADNSARNHVAAAARNF